MLRIATRGCAAGPYWDGILAAPFPGSALWMLCISLRGQRLSPANAHWPEPVRGRTPSQRAPPV